MAIDIKGWSARDVDTASDTHIEADFFGDTVASHIFFELIEVAFTFGDIDEVFFEYLSTFSSGGRFPFGLFGEEFIGVGFPVALKPSCFGGGGGSGAVLVIGKEETAIDYGKFAFGIFNGFVDLRIDGSTAWALIVGVFINNDWCVGITFDVVADVAVILIGFDNGEEIVAIKISGFVVAVDDKIGSDGDERDYDDPDDEANYLKTFATMHK